MAVWMIAAGGLLDKASIDNYSKTLSSPISAARRALIPSSVSLPSGDLYAWGFPDTPKGGNRKKIADIAIGDTCFFCTTDVAGKRKDWKNAYRWVARVSGKVDPEYFSSVSEAFWDSEKYLPYLLEKPVPIDLSFEEFSKLIDPSGAFYKKSPQGSTKLADPFKLSYLISQYGSVDNWAESFIQTPVAASKSFGAGDGNAAPGLSDSDSLEDRAAKFCSVEVRPEQASFRRKLFIAYNGRCVITGCSVVQALDAAHRRGRKWRDGHNDIRDGLLMRKDLHALYDAGLLRISDDGYVQLVEGALEHYPELDGVQVACVGLVV
ncbi:HNH endonuclease [Pseudomonas sp. 43A]|uniref:HNH endonuclease n=1 Tax=unclassified Pseudomonas TaxID=196821 RepID=UPI0015875565|nr:MULTISPECIES: HNH endonuclease signature motif containing protein [unclassified Pseudomonas]QKV65307.1 HNH endonuclease [Pseudomonas sp. 43A]QMW12239.1 HNH endonuclease [Pseudomonas sp. 29A]